MVQMNAQSGFTKVTDPRNPITSYVPGAIYRLGDARVIDSLVIEYLGGTKDIYTNLMTNHFYKTSEGQNDLAILTSNQEIAKSDLQSFKIYPNPAADIVMIEQIMPVPDAKSILCTVFDASGKLVKQQLLKDANGQKVTLNLLNTAKGQLYISLNTGAHQ